MILILAMTMAMAVARAVVMSMIMGIGMVEKCGNERDANQYIITECDQYPAHDHDVQLCQ